MQSKESSDEIARLQARIKELLAQLARVTQEYEELRVVHAECVRLEAEREKSSSHEFSLKLTPEQAAEMFGTAPPVANQK